MRRIGILGGTFDPPHHGHLILAEVAREAIGAEQVLFVPAADPPHKRGDVRLSIEHRLEMLRLAINGDPAFAISRVDIDRPGPHYTVDMLRLLGAMLPDAELCFLMGGDSLRDFPTWREPRAIMQLARLAVMRRTEFEITPTMHEQVLPGLGAHVLVIDAPRIEISSTDIVARLRAGRSARYMLPQRVLDYIHLHRLYEQGA
jgi:nicotinate-nucleotide adenylyltransferase